MEFKEEYKKERMILGCWRSRWSSRKDEHVVLSVLEVEVEFKEEQQVIRGCWTSRWCSRRMNMWL